MTQEQDNFVKILFRYHSPVLDEVTVETMWAEIVDTEKGLYKLASIPFYGPLVASDDIIFAEYDADEEMLTYKRTTENSGNSIINVATISEDTDINEIRDAFNELGCLSEGVTDSYFSMEILVNINYLPVKQKLTALEDAGIIEYAEPCLSEIHRQQV